LILNAYVVLDFFVVFLRSFLSILVFSLASTCWVRRLYSEAREKKEEDRLYLVFLGALLLLALNVIFWPLLYLLLQSFVSEWPEVMCIYGVTRIGVGSVGASRFLPGLIAILEFAKPALVFVSGAWLLLYLVNRKSLTGPLTGRLLVALMILGLLALGDALLEGAYLVIPKKEVFVEAGCCTEAVAEQNRLSRYLPRALIGEDYRPWLIGGYYGVNLGMILGLACYRFPARHGFGRIALSVLLAGALISLALNWLFLVEIAAPALLHRPHHGPYDLLPEVPESVVAIVLFTLGSFAVGWAACADWFGRCPETLPQLNGITAKVLALALFCYFASLMILSLELALA
jgi:hypothetical protein